MKLYTVVVHDHLRLYKYFCIYSVKMTLGTSKCSFSFFLTGFGLGFKYRKEQWRRDKSYFNW